MEIYGTSVADKLDKGRGLFSRRYFRQHCCVDYSGYSKDLRSLHQDLSSIFILDNSPAAYRNFTRKFNLPISCSFIYFLQKTQFQSNLGSLIHLILPYSTCCLFSML